MTSFKSLTVCLDMCGCPNRCAHCWLGAVPNGSLTTDDLRFVAEQFRPFTSSLEVADWYREPDFHDDYKERWELCAALSDRQTPHFELISYWRAVRDSTYLDWIKSQGVRTAQLTFFGGEALTDRYVGRRGAYRELVETAGLLLEKEIAPRIQVFVNKETLPELPLVEKMIEDLRLAERCAAFGAPFTAFVHAGSCDGENRKLYPIRIEKGHIPEELRPYYLDYDQVLTEAQCCERLRDSTAHEVPRSEDRIVLNIANTFDVYFNFSHMTAGWKIGNLKTDPREEIIHRIAEEDTPALELAHGVTLGELAERYGDPVSEKVFFLEDYQSYLLNRYIEDRLG